MKADRHTIQAPHGPSSLTRDKRLLVKNSLTVSKMLGLTVQCSGPPGWASFGDVVQRRTSTANYVSSMGNLGVYEYLRGRQHYHVSDALRR